ncbi:MAG: zinc-dependent metalloprotease, partial [Halobacteriota archaeon]
GFSLLLGYLARKVLGQYDPSLFGRELVIGQIYFVEPNIEAVERQLSFRGEDFRQWIAIHGITHAIVFESVPWLKDHINALLRQYLEATGEGIRSRALRSRARAVTNDYVEKGQLSLMHVVLSRTQIQLVNQIQALMSVVEGYSDFVMDHVGKEMLTTYAYMKREFELRRRRKTGREVLFERVTGLGMKMEQYVLGERFVENVATEKGMDFVNRVWRSPSDIPTLDELVRPNRWITRQESAPLTLNVTDD